MRAQRRMTAAVLGAVPLVVLGTAAPAARAHGAPTDPVSRVAACAPGGAGEDSAACRAAVAAGGGRAFDDWDNLRVAGVNGRDRSFIPDGELCSGGLDAYRGLDAARADWPATELTAGADFTLTYASTIPHEGSFSVYLTKPGYDPTQPLAWDDLDSKPFLTATDPPLEDGAYHLGGTLPEGRTGRQLLYTVWRNTSTPDTYYSCSDVVLTAPEDGTRTNGRAPADDRAAGDRSDERQRAEERGTPRSQAPATPSAPGTHSTSRPAPATGDPVPAAASGDSDGGSLPLVAGAVAVLAVASAVTAATLRRRPR